MMDVCIFLSAFYLRDFAITGNFCYTRNICAHEKYHLYDERERMVMERKIDEPSQGEKENRIFISGRLRHALDDCAHKTATLVVAPTGYGKTVAVRSFCESANQPVIWVNTYDKNPFHVWGRFCRMLFPDPAVAKQFEKWPFPSEGAQRINFVARFGEVLEKGPVIIVFDDYQLIQTPQIGEFFQYITREFATKFHLIIISQKQITDTEALDFATGKINRITSEDLRLGKEDFSEYLKIYGIELDQIENKADLEALYDKSEGWISMIYISVLNYLRTGKSDTSADMEHLVTRVIYESCSKNTRHFLSFLMGIQDFTKEQADFFNGGEDSQPYLTELLENHAFIRYDQESGLYHIHTIFMNCIHKQFQKLSMVEKCVRYERMAEYYIMEHDYSRAMAWYEMAGNYEGVLSTIELFDTIGAQNEDRELFIRCFDQCPVSMFEDYPLSLILFMWRFFNYGESERLDRCRKLFEQIIPQIRLAKEDKDYLWKAYYFFLSQNAYNDMDQMLYYLKKACEYSKKELPGIDRYVPRNFGNPSVLHMLYRGNTPEEMLHKLSVQLDAFHEQGFHSLDGILQLAKAEIIYYRADFDQAEILCHEALRQFRIHDLVCYEISVYYLLAQISYMRGDLDAIKKYLAEMISVVIKRESDNSPLAYTVDMCEAFFFVNVNYPDYLGEWIEDFDHTPAEIMPQTEAYSYMLRASIALHHEKYRQVLSYKDLFLSSLKNNRSEFTEGAFYLIFASASASLGKIKEAKVYIRQCAEHAGFWPVMLYARYGKWMMQPLQELADEDERFKEVINVCRTMSTINKNLCQKGFGGIFPTLTERENDIAILAMDGLSNKQIAAQLFISENTVKSSMKNIFGKLGISSRRDLLKVAQVGTCGI